MPHYEIFHSCALTQRQYETMAAQLTNLHCTLFSAPSAFVNVSFHRHNTANTTQFISVGGKQVWTNYIIGHLRPRGAGARQKLTTLVKEITRIWDDEGRPVEGEMRAYAKDKLASGRLDDPRGLHNVFIMEDIVAGAEQGFLLPVAGEDGNWLKENMAEFEERARDGDESMRRMVEESRAGWARNNEY